MGADCEFNNTEKYWDLCAAVCIQLALCPVCLETVNWFKKQNQERKTPDKMGEVNSCFEVLDFSDWEGKFCFSGLVKAQHSQEEADWREGVSRSLPDSGFNACLLRTSWCVCSLYYIGMEFPARPKSLWAKEAGEQARHKSLSEHHDSLNQTVFAFLCL